MDQSSHTDWTPKASLWVFVLVLTITFVVEVAIMLLLPFLPAWSRSPLCQAVVDASLLAVVMAPAIWWLVVKPLRQLSATRGRLIQALFQSQERERSHIARDLHDEIGQQLTALLVGLGNVEAAKDLRSAQQLARDLRQVGATAHDEVRRIARGLRPGVLEELGLAAAVERLCEEFEKVHGVTVQLEASRIASGDLSLPLEISLYRILQESLTNVAKHAEANNVSVKIARAANMVTLSIEDDGGGLRDPGCEASTLGRFGLDNIRERARTLDGECSIRASKSGGLLIQVKLPATERHE